MTASADLSTTTGAARSHPSITSRDDGFTLADLVSYAAKHNEANGEENRDGADDNVSTNAARGPTTIPRSEPAAPAASQPARLPDAGAGRSPVAGGRRGRQHQAGNNNATARTTRPLVDWSGLPREART